MSGKTGDVLDDLRKDVNTLFRIIDFLCDEQKGPVAGKARKLAEQTFLDALRELNALEHPAADLDEAAE